jgi:hypothetical protein
MVSKDLGRAVDRFLASSSRIRRGLTMQRARILCGAADAPRLLPGTTEEVVDLSGTFANDVDYYVYEMGRLRAMVKAMGRPLDDPERLTEALRAFDEAVPHLKDLRDARTHPVDSDRLDDVGTMTAAIRFNVDGKGGVVYLVDPRYQHHDAAIALLDAVDEILHRLLRASLRERPAEPLDVQIARRNAEFANSVAEDGTVGS